MKNQKIENIKRQIRVQEMRIKNTTQLSNVIHSIGLIYELKLKLKK